MRGLERAAAQDARAAALYVAGDFHDLALALHAARPGHHGEMSAADRMSRHVHSGVRRMEFPVGLFIGLADPLHILDKIIGAHKVDVHAGCVADEADKVRVFALGIVNFEALGFKTGAELLHLLRVRVVFKNNDHTAYPSCDLKF